MLLCRAIREKKWCNG